MVCGRSEGPVDVLDYSERVEFPASYGILDARLTILLEGRRLAAPRRFVT